VLAAVDDEVSCLPKAKASAMRGSGRRAASQRRSRRRSSLVRASPSPVGREEEAVIDIAHSVAGQVASWWGEPCNPAEQAEETDRARVIVRGSLVDASTDDDDAQVAASACRACEQHPRRTREMNCEVTGPAAGSLDLVPGKRAYEHRFVWPASCIWRERLDREQVDPLHVHHGRAAIATECAVQAGHTVAAGIVNRQTAPIAQSVVGEWVGCGWRGYEEAGGARIGEVMGQDHPK